MSLRELAAAIWPKVKGSSTTGVKKSTVCTNARSSLIRYTPASSLVLKPTSTFGSVGSGRRRSIESSVPGLSLAAQPAALTMAVSFTESVKPHLTLLHLDYSEGAEFLLASAGNLLPGDLHDGAGKCSYRVMPWDFWLIFLFLSVAIPWRGYTRLKKLLALPSVEIKEKLALYAVTIAFQWILVGVIVWRALVRGLTIQDLGLASQSWVGILATGLFGAILIGGLQWLNLRRIGKMDGETPELLRKLANRLLPVNLLEYLPYSALAITAGVCEEFVYRGFAIAVLSKA